LVLRHSHNRCFFKSSLKQKNLKEVFNEKLGSPWCSIRLVGLLQETQTLKATCNSFVWLGSLDTGRVR
jgi:hypothetical protein